MSVNDVIMQAMRENSIDFVTTVPCKQLAGVIEKIEQSEDIRHVPANREMKVWGCVQAPIWAGQGRLLLCKIPRLA
jgi:sulfopyruvate decarboxylase subunit alpha